jgi:site-specific DNA-methyltransferase (adenine-specific)
MTFREVHLSDSVTLYLGDCREVLPTLGRVDAVVTDPPYGLGDLWQGGNAASRGTWKLSDGGGEVAWDREVFDDIQSVVDAGTYAIIWGGNYYALPPRRGWLVWDKIARFTSGDCEFAWTNLDQPARIFSFGRQEIQNEAGRKSHPTEKPISLMKWCLEFISDARTIIDPFCGSGTTGIAAVKLGRRFIGIEIEERYFNIACKRIQAALDAPDLFIEAPKPAKQETLNLMGT